MKKKIGCLLLLIVICQGCMSGQIAPIDQRQLLKSTEPTHKYGIIYVIREMQFTGSGGAHAVYLNENIIGKYVAVGQYVAVACKPGKYKISTTMGGWLKFNVSTNKKYYVLWQIPSFPGEKSYSLLSANEGEKYLNSYELAKGNIFKSSLLEPFVAK